MLRKFLILAGALTLAQAAYAAQAGKVIFVAGAAQIADHAAVLDGAVGEGELLSTGNDGYIYIKTIDDGLFILRPNTQARIASYHVDAANPVNTRIKLELLSGVARSQSGHAVKQARQNFRFNTPVAAIGVRGTDFTVFTDRDTSRVTVLSGGITMSAFAGACSPDGTGPCEGAAARELSAIQKGLLLQVQRGQTTPQLLQGNNSMAPDVVAPPRSDEPVKVTASGGAAMLEPSLDARKNEVLKNQVQLLTQQPTAPDKTENVTPTTPTTPTTPETPVTPTTPVTPEQPTEVVVTPPVTTTPPVITTPTDPTPVVLKTVTWGRWTSVAAMPATTGVSLSGYERVALNDYYVLFRSKTGSNYTVPEKDSVSFAMSGGEAVVKDLQLNVKTAATLQNGQLSFNFDKATFSTQLDVVDAGTRYNLANTGKISKDALFTATNSFLPGANMNLVGVLSSATSATYLFDALLDARHTVSGVTVWSKK